MTNEIRNERINGILSKLKTRTDRVGLKKKT